MHSLADAADEFVRNRARSSRDVLDRDADTVAALMTTEMGKTLGI